MNFDLKARKNLGGAVVCRCEKSPRYKNDIDDDLRYYPINLTIADVSKRALGYYGMTLGGEIFTLLTVGFEYALNIIKKVKYS